MNYRYQRIGIWCGVGFFVLFGFAWVVLFRFFPPPSPMLSGAELLAGYQEHIFTARFGIMVAYLAAMLLVPWSAAVALELARIEGPQPMMAITFFGAGIANAVSFFLPFVFWSASLYRPDRSPEIILVISDMAWLEFMVLYAPYVMQVATVAVVGFSDKSPIPTFPRWFCFYSVWIAILAVPGGLGIFFTSGPFAWNGLIAFWIPVAAFTCYYVTIFPLMLKAVRRQEAERAAPIAL